MLSGKGNLSGRGFVGLDDPEPSEVKDGYGSKEATKSKSDMDDEVVYADDFFDDAVAVDDDALAKTMGDEEDFGKTDPKFMASRRFGENLDGTRTTPLGKRVVDVVKKMKEGAILVKLPKRDAPHFRAFVLSDDGKKLQWFSKKKSEAETTVSLATIETVKIGRESDEIRKKGLADLEDICFEIVYRSGAGARSPKEMHIEICAKFQLESLIWGEGLKRLAELARKGEYPDSLIIDVPEEYSKEQKIIRDDSTKTRKQIHTDYEKGLRKVAKYKRKSELQSNPHLPKFIKLLEARSGFDFAATSEKDAKYRTWLLLNELTAVREMFV